MVDSADTPAPEHARHRRAPILLVGVGALLLLTAALVGGILGTKPRQRRGDGGPAPSLNSVQIVEALMLANQIEFSGTAARATAAPSSAVPVQVQRSQPGEGGTSTESGPLASIKSFLSRPKAQQAVNKPASDGMPAGAVITEGWKQLVAAGGDRGPGGRGVICYPTNGTEIEHMVGRQSPCNVLVLRAGPDREYRIGRTLNVSTPKVLVGNPVNMPVLNCSGGLERLWDIQPGGRLDARFVTMVRGFGRRTGPENEVRLTVGSIAIVRVGGYFTALGCMLRERPNLAEGWLREIQETMQNPRTRVRNIGQLFLVLGGNIRFTGCRFFRMRPYGTGIFNSMTIGRDILVVAGNAVCVGCLTYAYNLYASNLWVSGNAMAVLGGTGLMLGGAMYGATGAQIQIGWGCQLFTAGGLMITIGWGFVSTTITLGRANGGQFSVGAGGVIQVGFYQGRAWGVGAVFGPGQTYVAATGLYYKVVTAFASFALATIFCGVGGATYVGSGSLKYIQVARTGNALVATTYGAGSTLFNGGGSLGLIYFEQYGSAIARWMAGAGADWFVGGGWVTSVNSTRFGSILVNAFTGAGSLAFVGLGGAVFIRSYVYTRRFKSWNTCPYIYTVAGMGTRKARGQNIFISQKGLTEFVYNKTDKTIVKSTTARASKTPPPTWVSGTSKHSQRRRLPMASHKPMRRYVEANPTDTRRLSWLADAVEATNALPFEVANKVVVLQDTLMEEEAPPPHPDQFKAAELKDRWGGYAKILADGLVDEPPVTAATSPPQSSKAIIYPGKVSANNSACFLCQVAPGETADHVGGPGACEVNDRCDGEGPLDVQAEAQRHTAQNLLLPQTAFMPYKDDEGRLHNADVSLLWHELTVYCRSVDPATDGTPSVEGCLGPAYLKAVALEYMGADVSKLVEVAVARVNVHAAVRTAVDEVDEAQDLATALAPEWDPECQTWGKFNVYITTTSPDVAAAVQEIWAEVVDDPTHFSNAVVDNADTDATSPATAAGNNVQPCRVIVARKASVIYPTIDKMPPYHPSTTMSLAPTLTVGSATAIVPVDSLVAGREYTVFVQNFPHNVQVQIVLRNAQRGGSAAAPLEPHVEGETVVAVLDAFDDGDSVEEVFWTARGAPGQYYLLAFPTNVPALFATSPVFSIVDAGRGAQDDHEEHVGQRRRLSRF